MLSRSCNLSIAQILYFSVFHAWLYVFSSTFKLIFRITKLRAFSELQLKGCNARLIPLLFARRSSCKRILFWQKTTLYWGVSVNVSVMNLFSILCSHFSSGFPASEQSNYAYCHGSNNLQIVFASPPNSLN